MKKSIKYGLVLLILISSLPSFSQGFDSTQIGKEYPYYLPLLGKKAYAKGYKLPLPMGVMVNTLFTKQEIVLSNLSVAFAQPGVEISDSNYIDMNNIVQFGPSNGQASTYNVRFDTWVLPFLSVSGYFGQVTGSQTVTLTKPINLSSDTGIDGKYWGFDVLGIAPLGPVVVSVDYSMSWTTNPRLYKPVKIDVASMRVVRNMKVGKKDMFIGVWVGAQYQKLASQTSGQIPLNEAIDTDGNFQTSLDNWYEGLTPAQKKLYGDKIKDGIEEFENNIVYYKFDKQLKNQWGAILGLQWQINRTWQIRSEYSASQSRQQILLSLNYRFGLPFGGKN